MLLAGARFPSDRRLGEWLAFEDADGGRIDEPVPFRRLPAVGEMEQRVLFETGLEDAAARHMAGDSMAVGSGVMLAQPLVVVEGHAALGEQFPVAHRACGERVGCLAVADGRHLHAQIVVLQVLETPGVVESLLVPVP